MTPFTLFHTALSILALLLGLPVTAALMGGRNPAGLINAFLVIALLTSVTGFFFPFHGFTPAIGVGIVATTIIAVDLLARFAFDRRGAWWHTDVLCLLLTEYFLVFVAIAQAFLKVPALHAIAPTGMETPFKVAQGILFTVLIIVAVVALRARRTLVSPVPLRPVR